MAFVPTCVFRNHQSLIRSTFICETIGVSESQEVLTSPSSPHRASCCPSRLPIGDGLSATSSAMEFDSALTRCHMTHVDTADVESKWLLAVRLASSSISQQSEQYKMCAIASHRACPLLTGVMVMRDSSSSFTVGLITHGTRKQLLQSTLLQEWIELIETRRPGPVQMPEETSDDDSISFEHSTTMLFAELPICSEHRKSRMTIWWQMVKERIVPNAVLPPFLVQCHMTSEETAVVFDLVRLFIIRPSRGQLRGGSVIQSFGRQLACPAPLLPAASTDDVVTPPSTMLGDVTNARAKMAKYGKGHRLASPTVRLQFVFDDLVLTATGEHLLAVEATVARDYAPFVGVLSCKVAPFRVMESSHG